VVSVGGCWIHDRVSAKTAAPHAQESPNQLSQPVLPAWQIEPHTCGMHSLSAVYRAYGLEPSEENLRFRLGVDVPASPLDQTSTGTLHPDLFRVLAQDGFVWRLPDVQTRDSEALLLEHLEAGHVAMALIARRQSGNLHWVCVQRSQPNPAGPVSISVVDSLVETPYSEELGEWRQSCLLSLVLVMPNDRTVSPSEAHQQGIAEMVNVLGRLKR